MRNIWARPLDLWRVGTWGVPLGRLVCYERKDMIAGLGKQSLLIGSAPHCDIRLGGNSVSPEHARVVQDGSGKLSFVDLGAGPCSVDGAAIPSGSETPFDFRRQFLVGSTAVPNSHPAIAALLMQRGQLGPSGGQLVVGRDPQRVHLVVKHPNV